MKYINSAAKSIPLILDIYLHILRRTTMKKFSKVTRIIVVVLALAILIGAVVALSLMNREQEL